MDGPELAPLTAELASGPNYAAFTTLLPGGHPQTQATWVDARDGRLVVNTETGHRKFRNVERDPRVTVLIVDRDNPFRYAEVRGTVVETVGGRRARDHIDEVAAVYMGGTAGYGRPIETERVMLVIEPFRQVLSDPRLPPRS